MAINSRRPIGRARPLPGRGARARPLDGLSATPASLYCLSACLRTAYTGALFQVRRASDNQVSAIGCVPATGRADTSALASFCSGTNGFVTTIYDQSGNGRDLTQGTAANQPKVYDSVSGAVLLGASLAALYDTNDRLTRTDACGWAGAIGVTSWDAWKATAGAAAIVSQQGGNSSQSYSAINILELTATSIRVSIEGAARDFTSPDVTASISSTVVRLAAGAQLSTVECRRNGTALSQSAIFDPTRTVSFLDTQTFIGATASGLNGYAAARGSWASRLSDSDVVVLEAAATALYGT